jgi:hypothetical protein
MLITTGQPKTTHTQVDEAFEKSRHAWLSALESPELQIVARALERVGIDVDECVRETASISEAAETSFRLEGFRNIVRSEADIGPGVFERFVLAQAVLRWEEELRVSAVSPAVKRITCSGLSRFANEGTTLDVSTSQFVALCKLATLRRFAAGQFDWERSGLPRSWWPRIRPLSALIRLLSLVALDWRAFGPAFFVHMPATRPVHALLEREALKAYFRMAQSMELQPDVKALIASAWLHSPATFEVSPHLAWLNKTFADHGAVIATMGPAPPDCGVFEKSRERQRAFSEGRFRPTLGLIVWQRADMLAWAAAHRELDS